MLIRLVNSLILKIFNLIVDLTGQLSAKDKNQEICEVEENDGLFSVAASIHLYGEDGNHGFH